MKNKIVNYLNYRKTNSKIKISYSDYRYLSKFRMGEYKNASIKLDGASIQFSSPFWFKHSLQEIFVDEVYKFKGSQDKVKIIDCGANVGLSIYYLKRLFPNAQIIGFEPDENVFKQLEFNIKSLNLSDIQLRKEATWINDEVLSFFSEGSVGGKIIDAGLESDNKIQVKATRLKNLLQDKIFFLKIDIEGAEFEVLEDCKDSLHNVENLFIEVHCTDNQCPDLVKLLDIITKAGFIFYIKEAWNNVSNPFMYQTKKGYFLQLNIFCVRK